MRWASACNRLAGVLMHMRPASIYAIKREVAQAYGVKITELSDKTRKAHIVLPRQIAMYLAKVHTAQSYATIGAQFGNRDHTTVMASVQKIHELMQKSLAMRSQVMYLSNRICPNDSGDGVISLSAKPADSAESFPATSRGTAGE